MGEYENAYPDAYGRREKTEPESRFRRYLPFGLSRHLRDREPAIAETRHGAPAVVNTQEPAPQPYRLPDPVDQARRLHAQRTPREICDEVYEALHASPFIDASGIAITVEDSRVMLEGTVNSLMAISLAKALTNGVRGVGRVQVRLRVEPVTQVRETAVTPLYKVADIG
jgi:hypothetical protein